MRELLYALVLILGYLSPGFAQATDKYETLVQTGKGQLQAGDAGQALASGEKAIKLSPGRWEAYALAGGALMNLKRYEDAADRFSKAINLAPESKQSGLSELRKQCVLAEATVVPAKSAEAARSEPSATSVSQPVTQAEVVLWKSIENSSNRSDFEGYLRQYPNGTFATLAHGRLDQMQTDEERQEKQEAQREYDAGISYWDYLHRNTMLNLSPAGFSLKPQNGGGKIDISCTDLGWQLDPKHHGRVTLRVKSTGKEMQVDPTLDDDKSRKIQDLSGEFVDALSRYCGSQGEMAK